MKVSSPTRRTRISALLAVLLSGARPAFAERPPAGAASASQPGTPAEPERPERLIVHTLRASDELAGLAQNLTDEILVHLGKREGLSVLGEAEVQLMIEHAGNKKELGTDDCARAEECLARLTRAAEADRLLSGRLARLGESYVVTLSLMDGTKAIVEKSGSTTTENVSELAPALVRTVDEMLGFAEAPSRASLRLSGETVGKKVAVVPFTGLEDRPDIPASLTQIFGLELRRSEMSVVTYDEIMQMIDYTVEKKKCLGGDQDLTSCLVEIGGALGVDYLATGVIGQLEDTYVLILKLIDISEAKVASRISESYRGPTVHLTRAVRFATHGLLGRAPEGIGTLAIVTEVEGEVEVDASAAMPIPLPEPIGGLAVGKHELGIVAEDYYPYFAHVYVEPGEPIRFEPELIERPTPWYKSWWFWTITGVVAAGTTTGVLLATVPPKGANATAEW